MSNKLTIYQRPQVRILVDRLREERRFIQVVACPRQVGKTTLVRQATDKVKRPLRW
ncbi:MAG: AAA family ATPase, partial [Ignavibacteriae bacterium]